MALRWGGSTDGLGSGAPSHGGEEETHDTFLNGAPTPNRYRVEGRQGSRVTVVLSLRLNVETGSRGSYSGPRGLHVSATPSLTFNGTVLLQESTRDVY